MFAHTRCSGTGRASCFISIPSFRSSIARAITAQRGTLPRASSFIQDGGKECEVFFSPDGKFLEKKDKKEEKKPEKK